MIIKLIIPLLIFLCLTEVKLFSQTDSVFATDNTDSVFFSDSLSAKVSLSATDSLNAMDSLSATDSSEYYSLSVKSNMINAEIFIDTLLIGKTPLEKHKLRKGQYKLKVVNPNSLNEWQNNNVISDIEIKSDTLVYTEFQYYYFISSDPYSAKVIKNDSLLGETPLRFYSDSLLSGVIELKKQNYKVFIFEMKNYKFDSGVNIKLQPKGISGEDDIVYKDRSTQFKTKRPLLPIFGTAAATLASGILAVNYKNTANDAYENYLRTGNSSFLNQSEDNDTYFTVSVIIMQAAIGALIYFLFFDK